MHYLMYRNLNYDNVRVFHHKESYQYCYFKWTSIYNVNNVCTYKKKNTDDYIFFPQILPRRSFRATVLQKKFHVLLIKRTIIKI